MKRIIGLLLAFSMTAAASEHRFEGMSWQVNARKYDVSLSLLSEETTQIRFYKGAGEKLSLKVSAPFLLPDITSAQLYLISSPMMKGKQKQLLAEHRKFRDNGIERATEIEFTRNVAVAMDAMSKGSWALVELHSKHGIEYTFELPAIDFSKQVQRFNAERNKFPPLSWDMAKAVNVQFSSGSTTLTREQQRKLMDLVEFVHYDQRISAITIDGHTDGTGDRYQNLTLSQSRANAVRDYLVEAGIDQQFLTTVRYHGQRYPLKGAPGLENRRVELRLIKQDVTEKQVSKVAENG